MLTLNELYLIELVGIGNGQSESPSRKGDSICKYIPHFLAVYRLCRAMDKPS
jgi:hypothetical protein